MRPSLRLQHLHYLQCSGHLRLPHHSRHCQDADSFCLAVGRKSASSSSPRGNAKAAYLLASPLWVKVDFCRSEYVCCDWLQFFLLCFELCYPSSPSGTHQLSLLSDRAHQAFFGAQTGEVVRCRQASKLAPRHLSWLSAPSSLGGTNRCAPLLFCSELITGFSAGEISKVLLASVFSSQRGVICRQAPQPWLSDLIWTQVPGSSPLRLFPSFAALPAPTGPPRWMYLYFPEEMNLLCFRRSMPLWHCSRGFAIGLDEEPG